MLFFVMVTLAEQKWIILRERQGPGVSRRVRYGLKGRIPFDLLYMILCNAGDHTAGFAVLALLCLQ